MLGLSLRQNRCAPEPHEDFLRLENGFCSGFAAIFAVDDAASGLWRVFGRTDPRERLEQNLGVCRFSHDVSGIRRHPRDS